MKKLAIFVVAILIIGGLIFWKIKSSQPPVFSTTKAKISSISKTVSASGKIISDEEAELKFQTSGLLSWVGVKEGDKVQAWQAIAQLDTRELQKNLEKTLRDYSSERNDWDQDQFVTYKDQVVTDTVKRILQKNNWNLDKAVLDVELKDIALKLATLITPISGVVTQVDTPVAGINITPSTAVFEVANPDKMIFLANIDEADVGSVSSSASAIITLDAYPDEQFDGKVTKISFSSVTTSGGGTAYPTEINLPKNKNLKFKVGMNGDVDIVVDSRKNVINVPLEAVFRKNSKDYVWVVKNGKVSLREVKIGLSNDDFVEIKSGLDLGEKIISAEVSQIKEGQAIHEK